MDVKNCSNFDHFKIKKLKFTNLQVVVSNRLLIIRLKINFFQFNDLTRSEYNFTSNVCHIEGKGIAHD
jgi:hypothetical protein